MKSYRFVTSGMRTAALMAFVVLSTTQLTSCDGALPPITITLNLVQGVEIPATDSLTGSAEVAVGAFCDLFTPEDLDLLVRNTAGDMIADLVTITSVELQSTNIVATEGIFDPFTTANFTLSVIGGDDILLGDAANNDGLGTSFTLTQEMNVDLLNDLEDGQCGTPTLRVTGGDLLESGDITFDATVTVVVRTQLTP